MLTEGVQMLNEIIQTNTEKKYLAHDEQLRGQLLSLTLVFATGSFSRYRCPDVQGKIQRYNLSFHWTGVKPSSAANSRASVIEQVASLL